MNNSIVSTSLRPAHRGTRSLTAQLNRAKRASGASSRKAVMYPLNWWRTRAAGEFKKIDATIARRFLSRTGIIGESYWHLAASGDAAVAISTALRVRKRRMSPLMLDVAMTAVVCAAIEGNTASALLIAAIVQDLKDERRARAISESWLARQVMISPQAQIPS